MKVWNDKTFIVDKTDCSMLKVRTVRCDGDVMLTRWESGFLSNEVLLLPEKLVDPLIQALQAIKQLIESSGKS